jgi:hypothetical protein
MKSAEIRFLRAVAGYRMTDHKCNENIREELGITYINIVISTIRGNG